MIGILIVSHGAFGESLIHSASHVLGRRPLYLRQLGVTVHDDPEAIQPQALRETLLDKFDIAAAGIFKPLGAAEVARRGAALRPGFDDLLNPGFDLVRQLVSVRPEQLDAIIGKRVVRG